MRAHCRHSGTVVTITGDVDAANTDEILDFASLFIPTGNTVTLDLSGVGFFAAQAVSLLNAVDGLCRTAEVSWVLIPSHAVSRVLRLTNRDATLPTAGAVPETSLEVSEIARPRRPVSPEQAVVCL